MANDSKKPAPPVQKSKGPGLKLVSVKDGLKAKVEEIKANEGMGGYAPKSASKVPASSKASGMGKKPAKGAGAIARKVFKPKRGK